MDLVEVDVRGVQARERALDGVEDGRAREALLVDVLPPVVGHVGYGPGYDVSVRTLGDETVAFGGDDDLLAGNLVLTWDQLPRRLRKCQLIFTSSMNLAKTRSESPLE